jgi:hypothetical protein
MSCVVSFHCIRIDGSTRGEREVTLDACNDRRQCSRYILYLPRRLCTSLCKYIVAKKHLDFICWKSSHVDLVE